MFKTHNNILKRSIWLLGLVFFVFVLTFLIFEDGIQGAGDYSFEKLDFNSLYVTKQQIEDKLNLDKLTAIPKSNIPDSISQNDPQQISRLFDSLELVFLNDPTIPAMALANLLTVDNKNRTVKGSTSNTLDTLFNNYLWASESNSMAIVSTNLKATLFSAIYDYWMLDLASNLQRIYETNSSLKYSLKYRTLVNICNHHNYTPNFSLSSFEKVVYNLQEKNYSYIMNRFKLTFGTLGVFGLAVVVLFTVYTYVFFILKFNKP